MLIEELGARGEEYLNFNPRVIAVRGKAREELYTKRGRIRNKE